MYAEYRPTVGENYRPSYAAECVTLATLLCRRCVRPNNGQDHFSFYPSKYVVGWACG